MMKNTTALILLLVCSTLHDAIGQSTAFTYHGRLHNNGTPVNGAYDLRFSIFDANAPGQLVAGPLVVNAVEVVNGLFTARLDFGGGVFNGSPRWLEMGVRPAGTGNFATLSPRQELTSSPYAIRAQSAGTAADVANGSVVKSLNTLRDNVTLAAGANVTITPSGNTLTIAAPGGVVGGPWSLNGGSAYYNGGNVGIGTSSPAENLTIAGVSSYNTGLKLTGNTDNGVGLALENLAPGGHKYAFFSGGINTGVGPGGFGIFDDTLGYYPFAISASGNVGIGTANPILKLHVEGDEFLSGNAYFGERTRQIFNMFGTGFGMGVQTANIYFRSGGGFAWHWGGGHSDATYDSGGGTTLLTLDDTRGLDFGSRLGQHLSLWGSVSSRRFAIGIQAETLYTRCGNGAGDGFAWYKGGAHDNGRRNAGGGSTLMALDEETGLFVNSLASVRTLTIRGGADLAEPFAMKEANIEKGSVVVIDKDQPGRLKRSTQSYDKRVAGIVSGANGINPGIALKQEGALDEGENVALTGRVYVLADANFGEIEPGDLLTTSDTPGHAMKVGDHGKAQGAILGKAMSALKGGKGMVLVLVTLQ